MICSFVTLQIAKCRCSCQSAVDIFRQQCAVPPASSELIEICRPPLNQRHRLLATQHLTDFGREIDEPFREPQTALCLCQPQTMVDLCDGMTQLPYVVRGKKNLRQ